MTDMNQQFDMPQGVKPQLPGGINVLTILTFIGCALSFCFSLFGFAFAQKGLSKMEEMVNSPNFDNMPSLVKKMYSPEAMELARKQFENRTPILLISLLGVALCLIGAINMRKLKMQGYYLYVVGELLPLVGILVFVGAGFFTQMTGIFSVLIILLFIALYTAQRKHLVNN